MKKTLVVVITMVTFFSSSFVANGMEPTKTFDEKSLEKASTESVTVVSEKKQTRAAGDVITPKLVINPIALRLNEQVSYELSNYDFDFEEEPFYSSGITVDIYSEKYEKALELESIEVPYMETNLEYAEIYFMTLGSEGRLYFKEPMSIKKGSGTGITVTKEEIRAFYDAIPEGEYVNTMYLRIEGSDSPLTGPAFSEFTSLKLDAPIKFNYDVVDETAYFTTFYGYFGSTTAFEKHNRITNEYTIEETTFSKVNYFESSNVTITSDKTVDLAAGDEVELTIEIENFATKLDNKLGLGIDMTGMEVIPVEEENKHDTETGIIMSNWIARAGGYFTFLEIDEAKTDYPLLAGEKIVLKQKFRINDDFVGNKITLTPYLTVINDINGKDHNEPIDLLLAQDAYLVSYDLAEGTSEEAIIDETVYNEASMLEVSAIIPEKTGYTFTGWNTKLDGTGTGVEAGASVAINTLLNVNARAEQYEVILYAQWSQNDYEVSYYINGGDLASTPSNEMLHYDDLVSEPTAPTRTGYTFAGWAYQNVLWDFATDKMPTNDIELVAMWLAVPTYTVRFESNGGTAVNELVDVETGQTIAEPTEPTKVGYTFGGWYKDDALTTTWNFATDMITADTTLYAKWDEVIVPTPTHTVRFESNGGTAINELVDIETGQTIAEPTEPTKVGYTFGGWFKEEALTTTWNFATDVITTDTILYAKWDEVVVPTPTYTVTFESNGGTVVSELTNIIKGETIMVPSEPTKDGHQFAGWYKDEALIAAWDFATDVVTTDMILYAKWIVIPEPELTYTVTFESNGGSAVTSVTDIEAGTQLTAPTAPTKANNTFAGWYKDEALTTAWVFTTDVVTADITLYANWLVDVPAPTYTVTFVTNGGTEVEVLVDVETGQTIAAPVEPTREGYAFDGWYLDEALTENWDFASDVITADTILYAKWQKNPIDVETFSVSYDIAGATGEVPVDTTAYELADTATALDAAGLTKAGYSFAGWSMSTKTKVATKVIQPGETFTVEGDMLLVAVWNKDGEVITPTPTPEENKPALPQTGSNNKMEVIAIQALIGGLALLAMRKKLKK